MSQLFTRLLGFSLLLAAFSSCQKDNDVSAANPNPAAADTATRHAPVAGNYLASKGSLHINFPGFSYTFDAAQDSIVFISVTIAGKDYYGLAAINKAHTASFGISSMGTPFPHMAGTVAGCQLLLHDSTRNIQYTLPADVLPQNFGALSLDRYNQDSTLAKGSFQTYLSREREHDAPFAVASGTFDLSFK